LLLNLAWLLIARVILCLWLRDESHVSPGWRSMSPSIIGFLPSVQPNVETVRAAPSG
jgi:hypothetical protein